MSNLYIYRISESETCLDLYFSNFSRGLSTPKENPAGKQASNGASKFPTGHAFEIILPDLIHKSKTHLR